MGTIEQRAAGRAAGPRRRTPSWRWTSTAACRPTSRVHTARMYMVETTPEGEEAMLDDHLPAAIRDLASARPDVVVFGCTSAGALRGKAYEAELIRRMAEETGAETISVATAVGEAINRRGARRVGVVTPYVESLNEKIRASLEADGSRSSASTVSASTRTSKSPPSSRSASRSSPRSASPARRSTPLRLLHELPCAGRAGADRGARGRTGHDQQSRGARGDHGEAPGRKPSVDVRVALRVRARKLRGRRPSGSSQRQGEDARVDRRRPEPRRR